MEQGNIILNNISCCIIMQYVDLGGLAPGPGVSWGVMEQANREVHDICPGWPRLEGVPDLL